jgi:hypothetical protein
MLVGSDYQKIEFSCFGLDLVEPNAMLGDVVLCFIALVFAFKVHKMPVQNTFFVAWRWFFILFGVGFFLGGLGHLMYNYWGVAGKYTSWYLGIISVFFIERALVSIHPNKKLLRVFNFIIIGKLILAILTASIVFVFLDLKNDPSMGLRVPSFNSTVGLLFALGCLGVFYSAVLSPKFRFFWVSVLVLIPAAFFQLMKINFHQWFDKNDASHFLLVISLLLYFNGVKGYQKHLSSDC